MNSYCGRIPACAYRPSDSGRLFRFLAAITAGLILSACTGPANSSNSSTRSSPIPPGHAQVARLPDHFGLQYCINLRPRDLAPPGAQGIYIHSVSAFITTDSRDRPAYAALVGRYPGWDTPGTTIYAQPFTNTNVVWLEIIHEFPLGIACVEAYGRGLLPARYAMFNYKTLVAYTYKRKGAVGVRTQKLFPITWGQYLPQFSPRHRPAH